MFYILDATIRSPQLQGIVKQGAGYAMLSQANTYAGLTTVVQGSLIVADPLALGSTAGGTRLESSGRLLLGADVANEALFAISDPASDGPTILASSDTPRTWGGFIQISGKLTAQASQGKTLRLTGTVAGAGDLRATGGFVELGGVNTYTGNTLVFGRLTPLAINRVPDTSRVHVEGTWDLVGRHDTIGGLSGSPAGLVLLGGATLTVATKAGDVDVFAGTLGQAGTVVKTGAGTWEVTGASGPSSQIQVKAGTFRATGALASQMLLSGGVLEGTGQVGQIIGMSGTLRPGASPGVLRTKAVTLAAAVSVADRDRRTGGRLGLRAARRHRWCESRWGDARARGQSEFPARRRRRARHRRQRRRRSDRRDVQRTCPKARRSTRATAGSFASPTSAAPGTTWR